MRTEYLTIPKGAKYLWISAYILRQLVKDWKIPWYQMGKIRDENIWGTKSIPFKVKLSELEEYAQSTSTKKEALLISKK